MGGHYYAYIKSFEDGLWYKFNDSEVSRMDPDDIKQVFGDKSSSATAYMLKYRRYTPSDQPLTIPDELIPEYLRQEIDTETCKMIDE
jgi:ubiquitin carboxyl-terminal hydrolase 47